MGHRRIATCARPDEEISVADAYDKGRTWFMGMELLVGPGALAPRPETELLGATAVDALRQLNRPVPRAVDMCCGASNLACAIAHYVPGSLVWASDLTDGGVEVARRPSWPVGANAGVSG